jgi:hypothetical protein
MGVVCAAWLRTPCQVFDRFDKLIERHNKVWVIGIHNAVPDSLEVRLDHLPGKRMFAPDAAERSKRRFAVGKGVRRNAGDRQDSPLQFALEDARNVDHRRRIVASPHLVELIAQVDRQCQRLALRRVQAGGVCDPARCLPTALHTVPDCSMRQ